MVLARLLRLQLALLFLGNTLKVERELRSDVADDPSGGENETLGDALAELDECYKEEDKRLARQRRENGWFGLFGDITGAACGGVDLVTKARDDDSSDDEGSDLLQLEDVGSNLKSNSSILPFLMGGCAVVQGISGIANGILERSHDEENAQGTNCERMAARATLMKLDALAGQVKGGFENMTRDMKAMRANMNHNHQEVTKTLDHLAKEEAKSQRMLQTLIHSVVSTGMTGLAEKAALLAAKLDDVLQRVGESMELTEVSSYKELAVRLAAAMGVVRGACEDILAADQDERRHKLAFPRVQLDSSKATSARLAVELWEETAMALANKKKTEAQSAWRRARDAFGEIAAVLVTGDLLYLHYKVLLRNAAAEWIQKLPTTSQLENLFSNSELVRELDKAVAKDGLLGVVFATIVDAASVLQMYLGVLPNYEDVSEFAESLAAISTYLDDLHGRLTQMDLLVSIVEAPVLARFPIHQECLRAAFDKGYTNTGSMVAWKSGAQIALAAHAIAGSTQRSFFQCHDRPPAVPSGITDQTFGDLVKGKYTKTKGCFEGEHAKDASEGYTKAQRMVDCNGKKLTLRMKCPADYWIESLEVPDALFHCEAKVHDDRAVRTETFRGTTTVYRLDVRWTCKDELDVEMKVPKMQSCARKPGVVTKTFKGFSKKLPYDPEKNRVLQGERSFGALAKFARDFKTRMEVVQTSGAVCNQLYTGGAQVFFANGLFGVGPFRFRDDGYHLWIEGKNKMAWILKGDFTVHNGGRNSRKDFKEDTWKPTPLTSVGMEIPSETKVQIGDHFIGTGTWRIGATGRKYDHLTFSWKTHAVVVFSPDGNFHHLKKVTGWHLWYRKAHKAKGVYFGDRFFQIGPWRFSVRDNNWMTIANVKTKKLALALSQHGTRHVYRKAGKDEMPEVLGRPICADARAV